MRRTLASLFALGLIVVASCSPDELSAPVGCKAITDCPLDQVCSRDTKTCIKETPNRLIGSFKCTVQRFEDAPTLDKNLSEVVARIGQNERFALPLVLCYYDEENTRLEISFSRLAGDVTAFLNTYATIDFGRNDIGLNLNGHDNAVEIVGPGEERLATSLKGYIAGDTIFDYGQIATGYVDIELVRPPTTRVLFGAACPNGLADCGSAAFRAGGASECESSSDDTRRVCIRRCATSGECLSGGGVCTFARCTQSCQTDADCAAPLRCAPPNTAGEGRGCTAR